MIIQKISDLEVVLKVAQSDIDTYRRLILKYEILGDDAQVKYYQEHINKHIHDRNILDKILKDLKDENRKTET